ncbi:OmpH family outer membrane protein [Geothrix sp. 21YS21S-4]|uniref:OmpH family outer membrane protein n=1 Tax=Geothrix sp. 21YS21S-4 TaxID=3068889 RepID=UPI0027B8ACF9|nr:OmpH family outer membrane protein [Geothrix sp. 21YS21S-4]
MGVDKSRTASPFGVSLLSAALVVAVVAGGLGFWMGSRLRRADMVFVKTNELMSRARVLIQAREQFQKDSAAWAEESKQLEIKLQEVLKSGSLQQPKVREQASQLRSRLEFLREKGGHREQELMGPALAEINSGIKKFAQKNGYRMVLGTLNGGVVLHGDDTVDVTEALLSDLNR